MKKNKIIIACGIVATFLLCFGTAQATQIFSDVVKVPGLIVGEQGVGGVTAFNGTIINTTTNDGVENPVTFGDDLRVDGAIWRGATAGPGDNYPIKFNDDVRFYGDIYGLTMTSVSGLVSTITELGAADTELESNVNSLDVSLTALEDTVDGLGGDDDYVSKTNPTWSAQAGYVTIHASDCSTSDTHYNYVPHQSAFMNDEPGHVYADDGENLFLNCPVYLPNGSVYKGVTVYYSHGGAGFTFGIEEIDMSGSAPDYSKVLADVFGWSTGYNALEQANSQGHVIDNENNLYVAEASFYPGSGSDSKFYGARIEYEITQPY